MKALERAGFLAHAHSRGFQRRVAQAQTLVHEALSRAPAFVSISWGKDSTAMLHLVRQLAPEVPAVFVREPESDLLDNYPEVIAAYGTRFGLGEYHEIVVALGESNVRAAMNGGCAEQLSPYERWPLSFMGLRQEESRARKITGQVFGPVSTYADGRRHRGLPLLYWTWEDVWAYTALHDLPYLASYDGHASKRYSRSSAVTWVQQGGGVRGMEHGRIQRMREQAPEYYRRLIQRAPWLKT